MEETTGAGRAVSGSELARVVGGAAGAEVPVSRRGESAHRDLAAAKDTDPLRAFADTVEGRTHGIKPSVEIVYGRGTGIVSWRAGRERGTPEQTLDL